MNNIEGVATQSTLPKMQSITLGSNGSQTTELQSELMGADGKLGRGLKAVFSGGLSEVRKKALEKAKAKTAGAGTTPTSDSTPASTPASTPEEPKSEINWMLWGGIAGGVVILGIVGFAIWKKKSKGA